MLLIQGNDTSVISGSFPGSGVGPFPLPDSCWVISIRNHQEGDIGFMNHLIHHSTVKWLLMPLEATGFFRNDHGFLARLADILVVSELAPGNPDAVRFASHLCLRKIHLRSIRRSLTHVLPTQRHHQGCTRAHSFCSRHHVQAQRLHHPTQERHFQPTL